MRTIKIKIKFFEPVRMAFIHSDIFKSIGNFQKQTKQQILYVIFNKIDFFANARRKQILDLCIRQIVTDCHNLINIRKFYSHFIFLSLYIKTRII